MSTPRSLLGGDGVVVRGTRILLGGSPKAPCQCIGCAQQYRDEIALRDQNTTYASVANIEEAQMILDEHVTSIRANQAFLRDVLLKHGNAISNRWRKASQAKRALSIQRALPDIRIKKWAIFERSFGPLVILDENSLRTTYLLPYLSLNGMKSDPFKFLSLLNARRKHDLDDWVIFDTRQTKLGWKKGYLLGSEVLRSCCRYAQR
jgi:hypothetical protein